MLFASTEQQIPDTSHKQKDNGSWFAKLSIRDKRGLIFHILYMQESHEYSMSIEAAIDTLNRGFDLDIPLQSDLVHAVRSIIEKRDELDDMYKPFLTNWRYDRVGVCTKLILRYALWELKYTSIEANIIINEAIELAKSYAEKDSYKFVNGILDETIKKMPNRLVVSNDQVE